VAGCTKYLIFFKFILRVLPEKLIFASLVKKFLAFYETRRFITVMTRSCNLTLPWARWIQSTHSHPISLSIKCINMHISSVRASYSSHPLHTPWFGHFNRLLWRVQIWNLLQPYLTSSLLGQLSSLAYYPQTNEGVTKSFRTGRLEREL
jgi:hypothetical protein